MLLPAQAQIAWTPIFVDGTSKYLIKLRVDIDYTKKNPEFFFDKPQWGWMSGIELRL